MGVYAVRKGAETTLHAGIALEESDTEEYMGKGKIKFYTI